MPGLIEKSYSRLAKKGGNSQPQGYLFWLNILKKENDQKSIIRVGTEGLKALNAKSFFEPYLLCGLCDHDPGP